MGQRFEGRNLEEALGTAATALGAERYQLSYHVVVEKRGFLGGLKRVVIEAEVNREAPVPPEPPRREARPPRAPGGDDRRPRRRESRGGESRGNDFRGRDRGRGRGPGVGSGNRDRDRDRGREREYFTPLRPIEQGEIPPQGEQSDNARLVAEWCTELFNHARLELAVRTDETEEIINVRLYGRDVDRCVQRDGELLDSVQVIANKALATKVERAIEFDCGSFKQDRTDEIGRRALEAAERVRIDGREQLLPAMSPIERRIVHVALKEVPDVTTESRGEGFFKRVAIIPRIDEPAAES
jgi:spoIIIJ-associated protein